MSREGRKKEVHRVLNGFLWSKGGVTGREIFMHPPLSLSLSTGWRPTGKKSKAQKPHTVWRWFLPSESGAWWTSSHPPTTSICGRRLIEVLIHGRVIFWWMFRFPSSSFFLSSSSSSLHTITRTTTTVWKMLASRSLSSWNKKEMLVWFFGSFAVVRREHTERPQEGRWMQRYRRRRHFSLVFNPI